MSLVFSDTVIEDSLRAFTRALDAGLAGGKLKIYSGVQPSAGGAINPSAPANHVLLVTLTFPDPSGASYSTGVLTLSTPAAELAVASGLATWARLEDSSGTFVGDSSVGATGGTDPIIINATDTNIYAGGNVTINTISYSIA